MTQHYGEENDGIYALAAAHLEKFGAADGILGQVERYLSREASEEMIWPEDNLVQFALGWLQQVTYRKALQEVKGNALQEVLQQVPDVASCVERDGKGLHIYERENQWYLSVEGRDANALLTIPLEQEITREIAPRLGMLERASVYELAGILPVYYEGQRIPETEMKP